MRDNINSMRPVLYIVSAWICERVIHIDQVIWSVIPFPTTCYDSSTNFRLNFLLVIIFIIVWIVTFIVDI